MALGEGRSAAANAAALKDRVETRPAVRSPRSGAAIAGETARAAGLRGGTAGREGGRAPQPPQPPAASAPSSEPAFFSLSDINLISATVLHRGAAERLECPP